VSEGRTPEVSDTRLIVPGRHEPPHQFDVTVTVARDGGCLPAARYDYETKARAFLTALAPWAMTSPQST